MTGNDRYEYWEDSDTAYDTKIQYGQYFRIISKKDCVDLLNEQEDKLKRIEKEVNNCNIYHDDLKAIILEIRCILNGDVE